MKDFKNSTRTQYMKGGACDGYAKGGSVKGAAKISKVMGEFKRGELHSGSKKGPEVTSKKQATAIALSEARKAGAKIPQPVQKKSLGGILKAISPAAALAGSGAAPAILGGLIGGPLLAALMKKKQSGQPLTPTEQQQVNQAQAQQAQPAQTGMKKGGKVVKKYGGGGVDRSMMESTSARPVKVGPTDAEKAAGAAVARGNRMQALEAREEELLRKTDPRSAVMKGDLTRRKTPRELDPRSAVRSSETARASKAVPVASREPKVRNPLMDRLNQLPSQRGEFPIRKSGGGLSVMPKGKKC